MPQSFETGSHVAIIANRFVFGDAAEFEAVADRAHIVFFDPFPAEIHAQVADWFYDQEIYDFVGERLHLISSLSARVYLKAYERKEAGGDWRRLLEDVYCHDLTVRIVQRLEADHTLPTIEAKVARFVELTGACRATYFNIKKKLLNDEQLQPPDKIDVPKRQVQGNPPAEPNIEEEIARAKEEDAAKFRPDAADEEHEPPDGGSQVVPPPPPQNPNRSRPTPANRQPGASPRPDDDLLGWLRHELEQAVRREDYMRAADLHARIQYLQNESPPGESE